jgi:Transposase IS66 family
MREQRAKLSRGNDVAKAMDYMLKRWTAFTRFLDDGRICLSNMPPSVACAASLWVGSRGCSAVRIAAASGPR